MGFGELIERHLTDARGKNTQLPLADLVRQSVYNRLAGYEDVNDAQRLSQDPAFRLIGSEKVVERGAALTSRLQSFETDCSRNRKDLAGLAALNRELVAKREAIDAAALGMKVEDVYRERRRLWVRLREKGGKRHEMPCHHNLEGLHRGRRPG